MLNRIKRIGNKQYLVGTNQGKATIAEFEQWIQETLDENNRLDRELKAVTGERDLLRGRELAQSEEAWAVGELAILKRLIGEALDEYGNDLGAEDTIKRVASELAALRAELEAVKAELAALRAHVGVVRQYTQAEVAAMNSPIASPEMPKVFPSKVDIRAAYRIALGNRETSCPSDFTYDYLRPWLRDPVGWELDVTPADIYAVLCKAESGDTIYGPGSSILDLCRSRIRPTFECKECAKMKEQRRELRRIVLDGAEEVRNRIDAARAALEGE